MKKYTLRFAVILFGISLVLAGTELNKEDFELFGYVDNNVNITLEKHLSADLNGAKALYKDSTYTYTSDIEVADFPFSSLGLEWDQKTPEGTDVQMEVRFFNGITWGEWNKVAYEGEDEHMDALINTNKAESFQYKATLNTKDKSVSPSLKNIKFTYINANDKPVMPKVLASTVYNPGSKISAASLNTKGIKYISRSQWGANEDLRLYTDDKPEPVLVSLPSDFYVRFANELKLNKVINTDSTGRTLTWPLEYPEKMQKIIIHHTGSVKDLDDPIKAIRDIYYYHTIAKGWGDIGYNYIIDQNGNIYEGRFGGEGVVGAHAGPGNKGSIGIAILGNYNDQELNKNVLTALELLISEKTKLHGIDPMGESYFRGQKLPNIIGHNSVMATSCPGSNIIKYLPIISRHVAQLNGNFDYNNPTKNKEIKEYDFDYLATLDEINLKPEKNIKYVFKLKNTGTQTWNSNTRINFETNDIIKDAFNVTSSKVTEKQVKPGQTGTFSIKISSKLKGGFYYIPFKPIFNGNILSEDSFYIPTIVEDPYFDFEFIDISIPKTLLKVGEKVVATVQLKNTGNLAWKNFGQNRISLGADNPKDRISTFTRSTRMGYLSESIVEPGQTGHFLFNLKAPSRPGIYEEYFAPVIEQFAWLEGPSMKLILNVK
jgi:hypothetical protein